MRVVLCFAYKNEVYGFLLHLLLIMFVVTPPSRNYDDDDDGHEVPPAVSLFVLVMSDGRHRNARHSAARCKFGFHTPKRVVPPFQTPPLLSLIAGSVPPYSLFTSIRTSKNIICAPHSILLSYTHISTCTDLL